MSFILGKIQCRVSFTRFQRLFSGSRQFAVSRIRRRASVPQAARREPRDEASHRHCRGRPLRPFTRRPSGGAKYRTSDFWRPDAILVTDRQRRRRAISQVLLLWHKYLHAEVRLFVSRLFRAARLRDIRTLFNSGFRGIWTMVPEK